MSLQEPLLYDHKLTLDKPFRLAHQISRQPRKTPCRPDIHYELHLGILLDGQFVSGIRDYQQTIKPGQLWLTAPWESHTTISAKANTEILLCTILLEKIGDLGPTANPIDWLTPFVLPPKLRPQAKKPTERKKVIAFAQKLLSTMGEKDRVLADCKNWLTLHELLLLLISIMPTPEDSDESLSHDFIRILPVIEYLKKQPHSPLGVYDAADLCCLGKSRFCDLFKQTMGITFGKYSIRARISGASSDIKSSRLSLKDIAEKWGFYDESHFYRQFQQTFNCTPGEFRSK